MKNIPTYRRAANGYARVTINGRDYSLGKFGTKASRQRYDAVIGEFLASGRSKSFGLDRNDLQMSELMLGYIKHATAWYPNGRNSETRRIKLILQEVKTLYSRLPVIEFGPSQFEAIRHRLLSSTNDLSRNYINAQMSRLKRMFRWAAETSVISWEAFYRLKEIKGLQRGRTTAQERQPVKPVCETLVAETLKFCSPIIGDMIRVQLLAGMRPHEICDLTPSMIDRKNNDHWVVTFQKHKTAWRGKTRKVFIGPEAQKILLPYLDRDSNENLFTPKESEAKRRQIANQNRITPDNQGNRPGYSKLTRQRTIAQNHAGNSYCSQSYNKAITYACKKGKLENWSANQLRHLAATKIRSQFGLDVAAAILGHSKVDVTQIYAENDQRKAIEAVRSIG